MIRGRQQRIFAALAAVLTAVLVGLLVVLFGLMQRQEVKPSEPQAGLRAEIVVSGPAEGDHPLFDRPLGAAFGKDGRVYVADTGNNRIVVFGADGTYLSSFGRFGVAKPASGSTATWTKGELNAPVAVDTDTDGNVYVADFYNDSISVFDAEGEFLRRFPDPTKPVGKGSSGQGGGGIAVTDVAVLGDRVLATDTYQVFEFTRDGRFVRQFGRPGTGPADLDHPNGIAIDRSGRIYVADSNNQRVAAFDAAGVPLWRLGVPAADFTRGARPFNVPRGVAIMPDGDVIVVDALDHVLVRLSADGKQVARYGQRGVAPGELNFPNSIDVDGDRLLVADKENNRVQVLRLETIRNQQ
ncbi:MAG: 6-bladed beta-propeller [Coriobacteriales bacterium]|nr:6-bladed beta-propeller [Coriobacteriales bacterium]